MNILPTLVSASDLQRDSARIIKLAKTGERPVVVVRNNRPQVAIWDVKKLQQVLDRIRALEEELLIRNLRKTEADFKVGKLKSTTDFSEFLDDKEVPLLSSI